MPTTNNIKLSVPGHGTSVDTWDADPINNNSAIIDTCYGSVTSTALSNTPVTLSATALQVSVLRFSGALSGNVAVSVAAVKKSWFVENLCTGLFVVTLTGGSGNVIALPPGSCQVYWDGTNMSFINLGIIGQYWDYPVTSVPAWITACTVPPALACIGGTFSAVTYPLLNAILGGTTLPDTRGRARFALNAGTARMLTGGGIDGATLFAAGGNGTGLAIGQVNLPSVNFALSINISDPGHIHPGLGIYKAAASANTGGAIVPSFGGAGGAVPTESNTTGITASGTAASGGSGTVMASVPPGVIHGITLMWAG